MYSFHAIYGSILRRQGRRLALWLLGAVFALFIAGMFHTSLWAADTAWRAVFPQQISNVAGAGALALAARAPTLFVQGGLAAPVGSMVDVPLALDTAGAHIAALSFSLDYDATCLALAPDDQDRNGLPDAIMFDVPAQFRASASVNPGGQQGRLDVMLLDYIPPLAALRDTAALITIQFRVICPLAPGLIGYAYVRFAATPAVGFSDNDGRDLPGVTREGGVRIIGAIPGETATPTPTPSVPNGSPTPTPLATAPSTPLPAPLVVLEMMTTPARIASTDRSVLFIIDYVILTAVSNVTLSMGVPEHTYFDPTTSTLGWQCGVELVNKTCQFSLYETDRQNNMSGRLFFAVALNWPLPVNVTQIEFMITILGNGEASSPIQPVILPVLAHAETSVPDGLVLDLHTLTPELFAGHDHELIYTFTYTNSSKSVLNALELRLVLPSAATVQALAEGALQWRCQAEATKQVICTLLVQGVQPNARGQVAFLLRLEPSSLLEMEAVVLVAYAVQEEQKLSSATSIVPIWQSADIPPLNIILFLPIINGQ